MTPGNGDGDCIEPAGVSPADVQEYSALNQDALTCAVCLPRQAQPDRLPPCAVRRIKIRDDVAIAPILGAFYVINTAQIRVRPRRRLSKTLGETRVRTAHRIASNASPRPTLQDRLSVSQRLGHIA